ncbi:helix-turn-helix domain-containing protein [Microbacterium rhizomatis]|uniref:Helix-turn-helix domain-containing protein n=1 Tax=Microbacterium rhizomatis TaxID=1631477 RepID=A0A5J5J3D8_9MICO|nr:helix-turn-helix domain-containing protein [Microbacterium rhizomatis]KAA9108444.1 helix-turn-helix domain-containing protein [Microbacterium rhizomatis]
MHTTPEPQQSGNSFGFTAWRGHSHVMSAPHAHNDIEVNYCASPLTYESGGLTSTIPAGVPCAFWGAKPHQLIDITSTSPLAYITIPLAQFMRWNVPTASKSRLLQGELLLAPSDELPDALAERFDHWSGDLHSGDELRARATALEIEAFLIRMTFGEWSATAATPDRSSISLSRAAEMATFISSHAHTPIRVPDVAASVHLHPNRAASIFKAVFGSSITTYLGQYRVAEAQRLLLTTEMSSAAIGHHAGFQSASSFHAAFAAVCGTSPAQWRRQHRTPVSATIA